MRISLLQAIKALQEGKVIGVPTETVYGLAAGLNHPLAIEQIFVLKGRPKVNPLIIHMADVSDLSQYVAYYPPGFQKLVEAFWPGPLTIILPIIAENIPSIVRANLLTAGFRLPSHPLTRSLLKTTGPLVMPSANLSGRPSSTHPEHVEEDFGNGFPVLDGGICSKGLESTIVVYQDSKWVIIRQGAIASESFQPILGYEPSILNKHSDTPLCPGQMFRHYAPKARLILGDESALKNISFVLGFKERIYPNDKRVIVLGSLSHPDEVAENLYQALRQVDQEGATQVWVDMNFPNHGLWQTIAERLLRAGEK